MRINLTAISFIIAFLLLSLGAVITSNTLWQDDLKQASKAPYAAGTNWRKARLAPLLSKPPF